MLQQGMRNVSHFLLRFPFPTKPQELEACSPVDVKT